MSTKIKSIWGGMSFPFFKMNAKELTRRKFMKRLITICLTCLWFCLGFSDSLAGNFDTIHFADKLIRYDPSYSGGTLPNLQYSDPFKALGLPYNGSVSLGSGGLIELGFAHKCLSNSGDSADEIYIFEDPAEEERSYVSIRPTSETVTLLGSSYDANGDGFFEAGLVNGGPFVIDIDTLFPGFPAGSLVFDAVQLVDDPTQGTSTGTVGADIDAVGVVDYRCSFDFQGDVNGDCEVNLIDLAMVSENWLIDCIADPNNPACHPVMNLEGKWLFAQGDDLQWKIPEFDDSAWQEVILPDTWENHSGYTQDYVFGWYRKKIIIPASWADYNLNLCLGLIDDCDETYFNGELIGSTGKMPPNPIGAYRQLRLYTVPSTHIRYGEENCIAVRVYDSRGDGGMYWGPLRIDIQ